MMKCSICNKNVAVVFITKIEEDNQVQQGLCLSCAQKQGIKSIDNLIKQTGMSEDDLQNMNDEMTSMLENMDGFDFDEEAMSEMFGGNEDEEEDGGNMFSKMLGMFKPSNSSDTDDEPDRKKDNGTTRTKEKKDSGKKRKFLDQYGTNLNKRAMDNEIDKVVGRSNEIERVIQILNRRTKNNPCLIGEPGVGKTAIAEGLALKIVEKDVPAKLLGCEVYLVDLTAMLAGTQFRGQFESRIKGLIKEVKACGNIILVIDEIHTITGVGESEGAMSTANMLKPALVKGDIRVIGATTLKDYKKYIEKDSALERRFQPIIVDPPSVKEAIEILIGIKGYYENFHNVKIDDNIVEMAVKLSDRYISDRFLPDKAIDIIDEAGARANLDNKGLVVLENFKNEYAELVEKRNEAVENDQYQKAAELKAAECLLEEKIEAQEKKVKLKKITEEDIFKVIEGWTKIPMQKISEEEAQKLLSLEKRLHVRIVGQDRAVSSIAKTIRRRMSFKKVKRPASFVFVGPTGVGKTELVKTLAEEMFGDRNALITLNMSEYMEQHSVSKMIGAPPGYVGYDEAGQLTERVRRNPYSVLLLDEIEKAHPNVFNMLLQILEDGVLTDSQGRTVSFENTIIIMTSNAGTSHDSNGIGFFNDTGTALENKVKTALKETFRPEFLNRIDEIIVFDYLTKEQLYDIVDIMLKDVYEDASEKDITISVDRSAKEYIIKEGYDIKFGARPLRRAIQKHIEDTLAEKYLHGEIVENDIIKVEFINEELLFSRVENLED